MASKEIDVAAVKQQAAGRWPEILTALGGVPGDILDGKHHPCPKCGGTDRFRMVDMEAGALYCNQCFNTRCGDGLAALAWLRGWDFPTTIAELAKYLGVEAAASSANGNRKIAATYNYCDEQGTVLYQVVRYDPKDFRQRRPKPGGGWDWSVKGVRVVPYRLPQLLAEPTRPVFVVEGEKDVENLARIGVLATCNAGGAGKWTQEHAKYLKGRPVVILRDNDEPGQKHAQQVKISLQGIATSVWIVDLPNLPHKGDVSDWIAAGGTKDELRRLVKEAVSRSSESAGTAQTSTPAAVEAWPEIDAFDVVDLPDFPTDALPAVLKDWVEAESNATQTPPDLAGLLALATCSAMIARRVTVEPRPGWSEPTNLFVAILLDPGNRKSAVFSDATRPLQEHEAELIEAERPGVARAQSERRQAEARLKKLEKLAAEQGDAAAREDAGNLAAELSAQSEPTLPRLIVDDATSEKLGMLLDEQGGRIASMSPEGSVFDVMAGLYSKSGMPQFGVYLMGHSGDDLRVDRVSRKTVIVKQPALTCAYAMQPAVIAGLAKLAAFRGRGLLARFLYAAPKSWIGEREIAPAPVPGPVKEAYRHKVRELGQLSDEVMLPLAADASEVFKKWEGEIESMLADGGQMEIMRDWGAKLAGATLRLAAVLHCVKRQAAGSVDVQTIEAAIRLAEYLIPHAEAVLDMMQAKDEPGDEDARYVLRWIVRHGRREFTKRDVHQHGKRRFRKVEALEQPLCELTRRNYIRSRSIDDAAAGPGRPPSPAYEVNPALLANRMQEMRSHNSQNPDKPRDATDSGNTGSAAARSENANRVQVTI